MGLFVLGMHRSGTSLVTGVVNRLGLAIGPEHQLFSGDQFNHDGYFELKPIVRFHDRMLRSLGGWASAPPEIAVFRPTAGQVASLDALVSTLFAGPHVVKDPRQCLLLPLWQELYGPDNSLSIAVIRNPDQVIDSLVRRNGYSRELALGLWERYNRDLFRHLADRPAFIIQYSQLVSDAPTVIEQLASVICSRSSGVVAPSARDISRAVDLVRRRPPEVATRARTPRMDLWEQLRVLEGGYQAVPAIPISLSEASIRSLDQRRRRLQVLRAVPDLGSTLRAQLDRRRHGEPPPLPRML